VTIGLNWKEVWAPVWKSVWVPAAAAVSLAPGVGTLTITGYAPTVEQTITGGVSPGVGTMVITGYAPAVDQTVHMTAHFATSARTRSDNAASVGRINLAVGGRRNDA
jgi:hypothetical protein